ncbi:protein of unknown function [Burkholderia multivorans]
MRRQGRWADLGVHGGMGSYVVRYGRGGRRPAACEYAYGTGSGARHRPILAKCKERRCRGSSG